MNRDKTDLSMILDAISEAFNIDKITILSGSRKGHIIKARQWFHYFSRLLNPERIITCNYIGKYYSDVTGFVYNHATVLNSIKKVKGYIDVYPEDKQLKIDIMYNLKKEITFNKLYSQPLVGNCAKCEFPIKIKKEI